MKRVLILFFLLALLMFSACAPDPADSGGGTTDPTLADFAGGVFKGPFLIGSTVTIYPLDAELNQTGISYSGDIVSDDGTYDISGIEVSGPVELIAEGYYYDEITGEVTDNKMTMRAITEDTGTVNINLFTALEIDRVRTLYNGGMSVTEAKEQATSELFTAFGLAKLQTEAEDISVATANGAALLAVSSMFAYNRTPADIQSLITTIRTDLGNDGVADVSELTTGAENINASDVRANLQNYYDSKSLDVVVPDFEVVMWSVYGSDTIEESDGNYLQLSSAGTVELVEGYGHIDGFTIPPDVTLIFTINLPADNFYAMFYGSEYYESFTVTNNNHTATATGPGFYKLDFGVNRPDSTPYDFTITVNNDGVENVVNYSIIAE